MSLADAGLCPGYAATNKLGGSLSSQWTMVDPENWTGALALESPGGTRYGTESSRGGVQGQGSPGIGARGPDRQPDRQPVRHPPNPGEPLATGID